MNHSARSGGKLKVKLGKVSVNDQIRELTPDEFSVFSEKYAAEMASGKTEEQAGIDALIALRCES